MWLDASASGNKLRENIWWGGGGGGLCSGHFARTRRTRGGKARGDRVHAKGGALIADLFSVPLERSNEARADRLHKCMRWRNFVESRSSGQNLNAVYLRGVVLALWIQNVRESQERDAFSLGRSSEARADRCNESTSRKDAEGSSGQNLNAVPLRGVMLALWIQNARGSQERDAFEWLTMKTHGRENQRRTGHPSTSPHITVTRSRQSRWT